MTDNRRSYIYAVLTVIFWSTVASAFKLTLRHLDVYQMIFFSVLTSTVLMFTVMIVQNKLLILKYISLYEWVQSLGLGMLVPGIYYLVLFRAYDLLPAQEAQPLNMIWPLVVVVLSASLLKQKIGWITILSLLISFSGVLIISTRGDPLSLNLTNMEGTILALVSALIWSLYWIGNVRDQKDEVVKLFINSISGLIFVSVLLVLFSDFTIGIQEGLWGAVYIGVFEMGITFITWLKALSLAKTSAHVSRLIYIVPFLSLIQINYFLGEKILISTVIGLVFVIVGILACQLERESNLEHSN